MMTPFTTLRQTSDQKSEEDDNDNNPNESATSPLIASSNNHNNSNRSSSSLTFDGDNDDNDEQGDEHFANNDKFFSVRVKLNDGSSSTDFILDDVCASVDTVGALKERILQVHLNGQNASSGSSHGNVGSGGGGGSENGSTGNSTTSSSSSNHNNRQRYLRLIVRGRMMAPDSSPLTTFGITREDVIHAVLAKEGVRGGQQARMLRRLNCQSNVSSGIISGGGTGSTSSGGLNHRTSTLASTSGAGSGTSGSSGHARRLWRRIGIDANGVVISPSPNDEDDDSEYEDDDEEEDTDLEMGGGEAGGGRGNYNGRRQSANGGSSGDVAGEERNSQSNQRGSDRRSRRRGGRRPRERRGFDRLRTTGMSREEVNAIRLYFSRSVDRYIERRRVIIRAANRLRNSLNDLSSRVVANGENGEPSSGTSGPSSSSSPPLHHQNQGRDLEAGNSHVEGGETNVGSNNESGNESRPEGEQGGGGSGNDIAMEGEEILNDRRRMEDEWMATQGPYSEFRMNLNTNNPLLLAAISGTNTSDDPLASMPSGAAGLFFRRGASNNGGANGIGGLNLEEDDDDDLMFGGSLGPSGRFHPYMGPLPSAGTDKDFVWGFILGFFVGFIMLFWVWMPTVPHKQKIGIISGISFQLGLNLLRKSGQGGDVH